MKQVTVTSIVNLEDDDWEKLVSDVAEHMSKTWVPIESDEDLPDTGGDYLVMVRKYDGTKAQDISTFYPMGLLTTEGRSTHWSIETSPMYTVLAWRVLPPMEVDDDD